MIGGVFLGISTIVDVAALAGVSVSTVSNVINHKGTTAPETEKRVREAIRQLNYIPNTVAKNLKTSRNNTVGIIAEDICAFMSGPIIEGISSVCEAKGYTVSLCNLRLEHLYPPQEPADYEQMVRRPEFLRSVQDSVTNFLSARVSGVIYVGLHPRDVGGILPQLPIPVVYTYCLTRSDGDCTVNYDDFQGAKLAVDHLAELGHRRIALISGPINSIPTHKRMQGYTESLMEHGLSFDPAYVCTGKWSTSAGYQHCCRLLDMEYPPSAIFCMSDDIAFGAMRAAYERGISVPGRLSLQGFDNTDSSRCVLPALTTVNVPLSQMGRTSAQLLMSLMTQQEVEARHVLLPCTHVLRQSTAPPACGQ